MPVLDPPAVQGLKGRRVEFLTRLTKGTLGDLANKAAALMQLAKKGIQRTLEGDPTAQLEQEPDDNGQGKAALASEVTRARSVGVAEGLRSEDKSEFRQ